MFLVLVATVRAINYICVIPTNHQFIINPTMETLRITNEVTFNSYTCGHIIMIISLAMQNYGSV